MNSSSCACLLFCALLSTLNGAPARADSRQFGDYEVSYTVFVSSFLQPQIAQSYHIVRASNRAVLNVTVRRRTNDGSVAVAASLSGQRSDLIYKIPLEFREIRESQAIYYLSEFSFKEGEVHYFTISINPEGDAANLQLQFSKTMYED